MLLFDVKHRFCFRTVLRSLLGASWSLLGRAWAVLELSRRPPLRVLFELPETLLGASWSLLGRSWAVLGRNWVVFGRLLGHFDFCSFFGTILGAKRVPKGRHFGDQNGSKIDQKKRCKFKSEKVTSWSRLGAILGRFPRCLGVKNVDLALAFNGFREHQRF